MSISSIIKNAQDNKKIELSEIYYGLHKFFNELKRNESAFLARIIITDPTKENVHGTIVFVTSGLDNSKRNYVLSPLESGAVHIELQGHGPRGGSPYSAFFGMASSLENALEQLCEVKGVLK